MQEAFIPQYPFECLGIATKGPLPEVSMAMHLSLEGLTNFRMAISLCSV